MKTLIIGASTNVQRYSYVAIKLLKELNFPIMAYGLKEGNVDGIEIKTDFSTFQNVDTITLYVGPQNQSLLYNDIINLKPRRVIFNPGTENKEFQELLSQNNILYEEACTLVMLRTGQY